MFFGMLTIIYFIMFAVSVMWFDDHGESLSFLMLTIISFWAAWAVSVRNRLIVTLQMDLDFQKSINKDMEEKLNQSKKETIIVEK